MVSSSKSWDKSRKAFGPRGIIAVCYLLVWLILALLELIEIRLHPGIADSIFNFWSFPLVTLLLISQLFQDSEYFFVVFCLAMGINSLLWGYAIESLIRFARQNRNHNGS